MGRLDYFPMTVCKSTTSRNDADISLPDAHPAFVPGSYESSEMVHISEPPESISLPYRFAYVVSAEQSVKVG